MSYTLVSDLRFLHGGAHAYPSLPRACWDQHLYFPPRPTRCTHTSFPGSRVHFIAGGNPSLRSDLQSGRVRSAFNGPSFIGNLTPAKIRFQARYPTIFCLLFPTMGWPLSSTSFMSTRGFRMVIPQFTEQWLFSTNVESVHLSCCSCGVLFHRQRSPRSSPSNGMKHTRFHSESIISLR